MPSPRRKVHVSFGDDDVSDMSSSFGSNHAFSIFRPKPPPSYDEDESLLLHKVVDGVLDQATGRTRSEFDVDAMTTEEALIQRLGNFQSIEESLGDFCEKRSPRRVRDSLAPPPPHETRRTPPQQSKVSRSDNMRLIKNDPSVTDEQSVHSEGSSFDCKRILWVFFLLFVVASTLGGIAGLVVTLLKAKGTESVTSEEQIGPSWVPPTNSPTIYPSSTLTSLLSSHPTGHPSTTPSFPPTPAPTVHVPTKVPSDSPATVSPTLLPSRIPTTAVPTRQLTLEEKIQLASPGTETAFLDPTSPQSLALENVGSAASSLDKFALLTLMYATNVTMWDVSALPCSWTGISCDDANGSVQKVELRHFDLTGTLPAELALANNLEVVSIAGSGTSDIKSNIIGSIPKLWGELLTNLRVLELYDNRMVGRIPDSFWKLSNLENFHLDGNQLTGIFPDSLAHMSSLKSFDVSNNYIVGSIPEEWTSLSRLARLSLKGNQMYGTLPSGMGSLGMLQELHLQGNSFRGNLPSALSSLTSLGWLSLEENQFTGTLPLVYSNMAILEGLELHDNKFRGTLPSTYGSMSLLRIMDVSHNFLTGTIPTEWNALSNLAAISLHHNQLHGDVSEAICGTVMHIESDCNTNMECSCCTACFISGYH